MSSLNSGDSAGISIILACLVLWIIESYFIAIAESRLSGLSISMTVTTS